VLPYDLFLFSNLHHFLASELGLVTGEYHHFAGTFHIYDAELGTAGKIASSPSVRVLELPQVPLRQANAVQHELIEIEERCRVAAMAGDSVAIESIPAPEFEYNGVALEILSQFARTKLAASSLDADR